MSPVIIAGRKVGPGQRCFVIAEAGVNHNGSLDTALRLVDAARDAGADAVKFQTFNADALASALAPKADYQREATGGAESQLEMLRALELPHDAHVALQERARDAGILFLSSPFDEQSADFLASIDVPAFKLSSGEVTNLPFLAHVARKGKPVILSTGMATIDEVRGAVEAIAAAGGSELVLLQCVSNYPADPADANLRAMATMADAFGVPVGYSDHTLGADVTLAAAALGATVIEKHLTLDRTMPGPDHQASMEPGDLAALVRSIRIVEAALGDGRKVPAASEAGTAAVARKSLVAADDIEAGQVIADALIAVKRPGTGLAPALRPTLVGRTARVRIPRGALLSMDMLA